MKFLVAQTLCSVYVDYTISLKIIATGYYLMKKFKRPIAMNISYKRAALSE